MDVQPTHSLAFFEVVRQRAWAGPYRAEEVLTWCAQLKIPMVTLWWLSTENLTREAVDVTAVLDVIEDTIPEWIELRHWAGLFVEPQPVIGLLDLCYAGKLDHLVVIVGVQLHGHLLRHGPGTSNNRNGRKTRLQGIADHFGPIATE